MPHTTVDAIYFAGLLDGEGSFGLTCHQNKYFYPRILVCNIHKAVLERGQACFGGDIRLRPRGNWGKRDCYEWRLGGKAAKGLLDAIAPYSIIKHKHHIKALNHA